MVIIGQCCYSIEFKFVINYYAMSMNDQQNIQDSCVVEITVAFNYYFNLYYQCIMTIPSLINQVIQNEQYFYFSCFDMNIHH